MEEAEIELRSRGPSKRSVAAVTFAASAALALSIAFLTNSTVSAGAVVAVVTLLLVGIFIRHHLPSRRPWWRFRPDGLAAGRGKERPKWQAWPARLRIELSRTRRSLGPDHVEASMIVGRDLLKETDYEGDFEPLAPPLTLVATMSTLRQLTQAGHWLAAAVEARTQGEDRTIPPPPWCPACGYLLRGLSQPIRCPECGWGAGEEAGAIALVGWAGSSWSSHLALNRTRLGVWRSKGLELLTGLVFIALIGLFIGGGSVVFKTLPQWAQDGLKGACFALVALAVVAWICVRLDAWWQCRKPRQEQSEVMPTTEPTPAAEPDIEAQLSSFTNQLRLSGAGFLQSSGATDVPVRPWSDAVRWRVRFSLGATRITAERPGTRAKGLLGRRAIERPVDFWCDLPPGLVPELRRRITRWRSSTSGAGS